MDFNSVLIVVATLVCPLVIGGMMWWMVRDTNREAHPTKADPARTRAGERLTALKQQRQALEAEIAALTRSAEQEAEGEQQAPMMATKTSTAARSKRAMPQQPR